MRCWIVLLRGVNVGGKNKLPMADFRAALSAAGFEQVQSYIQSGNVVLEAEDNLLADDVAKSVQNVLAESFDIITPVMILAFDELSSAMAANPFGQDFENPSAMFLFFLLETPQNPKLDKLKELQTENEKWELGNRVFYFYAGDGAGRSKVLGRAEKLLGVSATARNWKTSKNIIEILETTYG